MYRIYKNILHSFPGDFKILVKSDIPYSTFLAPCALNFFRVAAYF